MSGARTVHPREGKLHLTKEIDPAKLAGFKQLAPGAEPKQGEILVAKYRIGNNDPVAYALVDEQAKPTIQEELRKSLNDLRDSGNIGELQFFIIEESQIEKLTAGKELAVQRLINIARDYEKDR